MPFPSVKMACQNIYSEQEMWKTTFPSFISGNLEWKLPVRLCSAFLMAA